MTDQGANPTSTGSERRLQIEVRARKLLDLIEKRSLQLRDSERQTEQTLFNDPQPAKNDSRKGFYRDEDAEPLTLAELNRYTSRWKALLPQEAEVRAALVHLLALRYTLTGSAQRRLQAAIGFDLEAVQQAYAELYNQPLETVFRQAVDTRPQGDLHPEEVRSQAITDVAQDWDLSEQDDELEWISLGSGEMLYQEGQPGDALYILISGRLRSVVGTNGEQRVVAEIGRGEMVGEVSMLSGGARSTSVYAVRDCELIRITPNTLHTLTEKRPQLMNRIVRDMAVRMRAHTVPRKSDSNNLVTFAVIRAGKPEDCTGPALCDTDSRAFIFRLAESLSGYGPTLLINSEVLDRQLGEGWAQTPENGEGSDWLAAYLSEQESHYRYIIYEADAQPSEWTRRCLRQADRILIVARTGEDPAPGPVEELLKESTLTVEAKLILVHPDSTTRPSGTHRWLKPRKLKGHLHARENHTEDMQRIARRLTGRSLGLALSGGGARGYAHLGVIRALKEAGLHVDAAGGTSMGSIVGAVFALDMDEKEIMEVIRRVSSPLKLFDLTLPLVSFFKSEKVTKVLQDVFGDTQIEDLWRPYFCVSSNLTRAKSRVHMQGPLWQALRASSAIPGIFSPVLDNGELLVDGAVLNNLPVDLMKDFAGVGPIIGVNVFPEVDLLREYDFGNSVSGWEVLLRRLNPFSDNVSAPLIFENLLRVIALNDVHLAKTKAQMCELYITPSVERFGILEFQSYRKIIDIGYRSAREAIETWSQKSGAGDMAEGVDTVAAIQTLNRTLADLDAAINRLTQAVPV